MATELSQRAFLARTVLKSALLVTVSVVISFGQNGIPMATPKGTLTLFVDDISQESVGGMKLGSSLLRGSVRNDTEFRFASLRFELIAYNEAGKDLRLCDEFNLGSRCEFHIFHPIEIGASVRLDQLGGTFRPARPVPKREHIAKVEYHVLDAPYFVKYDVQAGAIENEKFTIVAAFGLFGISLDVRNTSSDLIEIAWDQSVFIDQDANSSRLIRGNVRLLEKDRTQPNTIMPPGTKLKETVFPVAQIKQKTDGSLYQESLFPEVIRNATTSEPSLRSLKGKELRLFLRFLVNDQKQNVTIAFKVAGVAY